MTTPSRSPEAGSVRPVTPLTSSQRKHLKGLGHHLAPLVRVGKGGISDVLIAEVAQAIEDHELVKVKLLQSYEGDKAGVSPFSQSEAAGAAFLARSGADFLRRRTPGALSKKIGAATQPGAPRTGRSLGNGETPDKNEAAAEVARRANAALVQRIGKTILLYAPHPEEPRIKLPR